MAGQRKSEVRRWYQQAVYGLKAARWNIEGGFYSAACFLAQQAGEKALKSLLYYLGSRRTALFTHSLVEMIREVKADIPAVAEFQEEARSLDLHYVPSALSKMDCPTDTHISSTAKTRQRRQFVHRSGYSRRSPNIIADRMKTTSWLRKTDRRRTS